ncbi:MAG TPA: Sapep family Mn(2+)-dependent dipeptidase [Candidatus Eisenbergiella stercorigallinarum]|uniref:Sapep family Mn(2+)-dependent dipeptidase n=1 Tax=Candidatus Eisenbergiella stercorigallinarum TaxID=2838557 RepID=A0A9D2TZF0_9FIRM|nr:Sapep family Mn(2+)-dependent dipeptidase [Candidatus Eisenbergiella stercorigallinarum]
MYDKETYLRVSAWFDAQKEKLIRDIQRIVRIPSVSEKGTAGAPFGEACREAMDLMLQIGREHGFYTENYEYYVGSIGEKDKDWGNLIGFWNHLDVVPAGGGWDYPPFDAVRRGDLIIGRGSQDNKGPAVGMLYVMECIRELKLDVRHELCLFVGCDEERGMKDMEYYTSHYPCPALSLIADCGFPVCYGEKGIVEGKAVSRDAVSGMILELYGGSAGNIIPDRAVLALKKEAVSQEQAERLSQRLSVEKKEDRIILTALGSGGHSAFPEGSSNAVYLLADAVVSEGILSGRDGMILEAIKTATQGNYGEELGIAFEDDLSGRLTCVGTVLRLCGGHAELTFNIRYPVTDNGGKICERLADYWKERDFQWKTERDSGPNYFDPSHPAVGRLTEVYNGLTKRQLEPYTMGGGTYARKLPDAFGFGIGNMPEKRKPEMDLLQPGHGNAHGPDEVLDCERLTEALKIYVMGLLALSDISLT